MHVYSSHWPLSFWDATCHVMKVNKPLYANIDMKVQALQVNSIGVNNKGFIFFDTRSLLRIMVKIQRLSWHLVDVIWVIE